MNGHLRYNEHPSGAPKMEQSSCEPALQVAERSEAQVEQLIVEKSQKVMIGNTNVTDVGIKIGDVEVEHCIPVWLQRSAKGPSMRFTKHSFDSLKPCQAPGLEHRAEPDQFRVQ